MLLHSSVSVSLCSRLSFSSKFLSDFRHSYSFLSHFSSCSDKFRVIFLKPHSKQFKTFGTSSSAVAADGNADTFYASESVSWTSLGLCSKISRALADSGIERPSLIQAASIPSIISGKDVVIAAETGSGKTHSYLAPLINQLCSVPDSKSTDSDEGENPSHRFVLVLCPNVLLCQQVVQMANGFCEGSGIPLLKVAAVCGKQGWPVDEPDIIVSTPAALLNYIEPNKNHRLLFLRAVKYVVFDEADMLLGGGFLNKVIRLIHMLRFDEKLFSSSKKDPDRSLDSESDPLLRVSLEDEKELQTEIFLEAEENNDEVMDVEDDDIPEAENLEAGSIGKKDWRRVRKSYERSKQYIFVAATLPVNGKKTAGALLKKLFPDATWISGNYLHCHSPRLEQTWIEVTIDSQVEELIKAVNQRSKSQPLHCGDGVSRTMIFGNTVEAVEAVANILVRSGIECFRYHKDCTLEERAKTLAEFREKGGVLVCTDAASRGVDIPNVAHVIQADFATSAIDFLHRIGRTGRASNFGLVTSLYTESNRDLVSAVRRAGDLSQPVETAFSRKRSFRNKIKKRGLVTERALA